MVSVASLAGALQTLGAQTAGASANPAFAATALTSYSARLSWTVPPRVTRIRILRDGRLIDDFPAISSGSYTDYLLWANTRYRYAFQALSSTGKVLARLSSSVTTPAQVGSFPVMYSPTSFWNTLVPGAPAVDPDSSSMVAASINPFSTSVPIDNDDGWGIPIAYANPVSRLYSVGCTIYNCQQPAEFRIPAYAQANLGSGGDWDGHLAVYDPSTNGELDMWEGSHDPISDTWTASSRSVAVADWGAVCPEGLHCSGGGVAAGFLQFGGVIRPEEIAQGHIDHALVIALPYVRADYISCPATDIWASWSPNYQDDPAAIPLGAHLWLPRTFDVDAQSWPNWEKVVARALQEYGAYVVDIGANIALRGEANLDRGYDAWSLVGLPTVPHPNLATLPWDQVKVLQLKPC